MSADRASVPTCHTTTAAGAPKFAWVHEHWRLLAQLRFRLPGGSNLDLNPPRPPATARARDSPTPNCYLSSTDTSKLQPKAQRRATTQPPKSEAHQTSPVSPPSGTKPLTDPKPSPPPTSNTR
ncbi:hypothetical protein GCG54_00002583 [Colletotrichum gloeosporioides]|uniref:Uncharacterized protein n=1 Tax=Colletotrichum gloeosporioides TaxID=474922 RepID=A0A8H4CU25_COLGL|nr:uncharacterized protein GCG54_00002583 [Colletotrichum gloeosporioides]KAF3810131.1 hypothetical protein GCG54_00002583 [Colletotrichum gloeosporioides]